MPEGHLGPAGARRKEKDPAANFGLNCDYFGQNCDTRTRAHAHTRTRKKIATYNVHPFGVHICTTFGGALEPVTSRRRVDVRP